MRLWLVIVGVVILVWGNAFAESRYPFEDVKQQAQFQSLLHDLRCPVCQNQDLAESNSGLALDLREEVYHMVQDHHSDQDIIHYLTARYGEFILFKPTLTMTTAILWFGPLALLLLGLMVFAMTCVRKGCDE